MSVAHRDLRSPGRRARNGAADRRARLMIHLVLSLVSLMVLLPVLLVVSSSFASESAIGHYGYSLLPRNLSLDAYRFLFESGAQIPQAYRVSLIVTFGGASLSLLVMSLIAYPLSRRDFALRRPLSFYVFFTMLFNGGLVPFYIMMTQYLHLGNTLWALILPYLVVPFYVLILRTFFAGIPFELIEAAKLDGAGEWRIFLRIVLPLSTPALATVGLFSILTYWNDWYQALLFISDQDKYPLQYLLYNINANIGAVSNNLTMGITPPTNTGRMAMAVLAIGPVAFVFVFVQRFFVRGLTLGSLK
ncbi:MAG: Sugar transporter permease [Chloroflexi bacterium]|jgi:putative aldouronate transport system permease protein|nr:Sugar transporter permease [Chloroflexota bacterium]